MSIYGTERVAEYGSKWSAKQFNILVYAGAPVCVCACVCERVCACACVRACVRFKDSKKAMPFARQDQIMMMLNYERLYAGVSALLTSPRNSTAVITSEKRTRERESVCA